MKAVTELRAEIDAFAARYAARRVAAGADPEPLLVAFERLQSASRARDYAEFGAADNELHQVVICLAALDGLREVWVEVAARMQAFHAETLRSCWPDLSVLFEAHRAIVDAICDGDAMAAEAAARAHLDAVWYRLAEHTNDLSLPHDPVSRATAYLALHLDQPIRLALVARDVAKVSKGHLARLFREQHGVSFTEYVREMRLQAAADFLRRTRQPIKQVAARVGWSDPSRFTQQFARRFKLTPSAYRQRFGKQEMIS